jgi:hypothetical protein
MTGAPGAALDVPKASGVGRAIYAVDAVAGSPLQERVRMRASTSDQFPASCRWISGLRSDPSPLA